MERANLRRSRWEKGPSTIILRCAGVNGHEPRVPLASRFGAVDLGGSFGSTRLTRFDSQAKRDRDIAAAALPEGES